MKITNLSVKNFKNFESADFQFHPQFNLIVGVNGTGKTSLLDALSIAVGSWFLGISEERSRGILTTDISFKRLVHKEVDKDGFEHHTSQWQRLFPCELIASGEVAGHEISWTRDKHSPEGRTRTQHAAAIKQLAEEAHKRLSADQVLPLISYYGAGRLWQEPRQSYKVRDPKNIASKNEQTRLHGYQLSIDSRVSVANLTRWIARQSWITFQQKNRESPIFKTVKDAILGCMDGATDIDFDAEMGEVVISFGTQSQPFSNLSDGQRCMLAMVGDIAQKAATLNPHLGSKALQETTGIVLIDELDLHLHPKWQRRVVDDLRNTFPGIQFICTTHSPFLIQSVHSSEELIMLDGQPLISLDNKSINEIARGIQQIENPEVSQRYESMKQAARSYLEQLETVDDLPAKKLEDFKQKLADGIGPYAENAAFQAFLEMKRVAKLGE